MTAKQERQCAAACASVTLLIALLMAVASAVHAWGRDLDGKYAQSDPAMHTWFEALRSGKGSCCSYADGMSLYDVDWDSKDGHYRVRIEDQWFDVPDEAVITEPNKDGRTIVWPIYYRSAGKPLRIEVRCFMPGARV
jgi:hypothetical protein